MIKTLQKFSHIYSPGLCSSVLVSDPAGIFFIDKCKCRNCQWHREGIKCVCITSVVYLLLVSKCSAPHPEKEIFLLPSGWLCCGLNGWCIWVSLLMTARRLEAAEAGGAWGLRQKSSHTKIHFPQGGLYKCFPPKLGICLKVLGISSQKQLPLLSEIQSVEAGGGRQGSMIFLFIDT